ncbi:uncharacterized protein LOC110030654 [Phalaenopsis equestris]|uniref:uncharacterized protein LOC110030654 n=1 Tax=Phalaenopsis equestris TaxID=78828 RepID=UPI0009E3E7F2|nr:uncharacterized protein LOC110030654 [Phalaenopsis equestris]
MEKIDEAQELNGGLKGYWNPRAYQKLDRSGRRSNKRKLKLGGGWRVKVSPKLKVLQDFRPKRIFAQIRQGYVRAMLGFAGKLWYGNGQNEYVRLIGGPSRKEYEERLILQLQRQILERNRRYAAAGITGVTRSGENGL